MALINCKDCGNQISNESTKCIHCGCPVEKDKKKVIIQIDSNSNIIDDASGITQAFVYIDGNFIGELKKDNHVLTTELTIGEHDFSLEFKAGLPRSAGLLFAVGHVPVVSIEAKRKKKIIIAREYEITKIIVGRDDDEIVVINYNINEDVKNEENDSLQSINLSNENLNTKEQINNLTKQNETRKKVIIKVENKKTFFLNSYVYGFIEQNVYIDETFVGKLTKNSLIYELDAPIGNHSIVIKHCKSSIPLIYSIIISAFFMIFIPLFLYFYKFDKSYIYKKVKEFTISNDSDITNILIKKRLEIQMKQTKK